MAWIVKPSGTQSIERQDQPLLTEALREQLTREILPRYATKRAALLPTLHAIQHEHGWLPHQAIEEAAEFLELSPAEVLDTATFYEEFHLRPKGRFLVQICQSISCELCGERELLRKVEDKLGIVAGETTADGNFTLMTVECLGSCGTAPALLIDEKLHENVTWEQLEAELDRLAAS
jgi:NADH-quinone oxidoreductase subunit E